MKGMINMKKILILAIMVLGLNTNVFAWYDYSAILEDKKEDNINNTKDENKKTDFSEGKLKNE